MGETRGAALQFFYPPSCLVCGSETERTSPLEGACGECYGEFSGGVEESRCYRCGEPVGPHLDASVPCSLCRETSFAFERVIRWGLYEEGLRDLCVRGKHAGGPRLLSLLARAAASDLKRQLGEDRIDLIVPVPQFWTQRLLRPHNSAEILAREWSEILEVPYHLRQLRKMRATPKQVGLSQTARRKNLRNAFGANLSRKYRKKTVLLVDDVLTTGSTAHQSARALLQGGAGRVIVAVIARSRYSR